MSGALRIGIAGLGTVGAGTLRLLQEHGDILAQRCGRPIVVGAVSARERKRDRGVDVSKLRWCDDALALAGDPEIDVVVELIGGSDGIARRLIETAIANRKHVVTANKALLAHHGAALARAAESNGVTLAYEAAVAGGIPIIKALREGLAGNRVERIYGILNGTCNYILTTMRRTGREFADVLAEAQKLGYAEADPSFDVDGVDAAHKLAILTSVAFGCEINFAGVHVEGIRNVSAMDIAYAEELGSASSSGRARPTEHGIEQRVHACMVPIGTPIAHVEGVFNAVVTEGDSVGQNVAEGRGAGRGDGVGRSPISSTSPRGRTLPTFSGAGGAAEAAAGLADGAPPGRLLCAAGWSSTGRASSPT
jgi:homoserine dehydrogenase